MTIESLGAPPAVIDSAPKTNPLRVLVVDDDASFVDTLRSAVEECGFTCSAATSASEAWELHRKNPFDIVLCDWLMPQMNGLELCKKMRALEHRGYTYFILLTGLDDQKHLVLGLKEGADEFLVKPLGFEELSVRLQSAARVADVNRKLHARTEILRRDSEQSIRLARVDPLTGLGNRLALEENLSLAMSKSKRYGHRYCVAMCDVDFFKKYNDTHGHLAGDEVLRAVSSLMRDSLREGDLAYRYGGEEFVVILPEQKLAAAVSAMNRLRVSIEQLQIRHDPDKNATSTVTISIGVAELSDAVDRTALEWLKRADGALYQAKEKGRNCVISAVSPT